MNLALLEMCYPPVRQSLDSLVCFFILLPLHLMEWKSQKRKINFLLFFFSWRNSSLVTTAVWVCVTTNGSLGALWQEGSTHEEHQVFMHKASWNHQASVLSPHNKLTNTGGCWGSNDPHCPAVEFKHSRQLNGDEKKFKVLSKHLSNLNLQRFRVYKSLKKIIINWIINCYKGEKPAIMIHRWILG